MNIHLILPPITAYSRDLHLLEDFSGDLADFLILFGSAAAFSQRPQDGTSG